MGLAKRKSPVGFAQSGPLPHKLVVELADRMSIPRLLEGTGPPLPKRWQLRRWQRARTWARLVREAEALWHVDVRDLRRLGALELDQLLHEVPPSLRPRVNRWLGGYRARTRLH